MVETVNLVQNFFWIAIAAGFALSLAWSRHQWAIRTVAWVALTLFGLFSLFGLLRLFRFLSLFRLFDLFGLNDFVDMRTAAWWCPWWLPAWKATSLGVMCVLLLLCARKRRQTTAAARANND
ncbi:MAG: hypothetical protein J7M14_04835 [Planctomycetes bacterium]|nr:hypothetical protein [Planctomycetota bacterium]